MKVYTKTGDRGQTSLATGERVSKTDSRLEAYGTADELNSFVGNLLSAMSVAENVTDSAAVDLLTWTQSRLFDIGATLAGVRMPLPEGAAERLETAMDRMQAELEPLRAFILPAGSETVTRCHICRTVTRRLERNVLCIEGAVEQFAEELIFINRLSDYFFVLARYIAKVEGNASEIWQK